MSEQKNKPESANTAEITKLEEYKKEDSSKPAENVGSESSNENSSETKITEKVEKTIKLDEDGDEVPAKQPSDAKFLLGITFKLLLISAITALLLSGVNALTAEKIAANIAAEKAAAITAIFPNAEDNSLVDITPEGVNELYTVSADGEVIGYVASVSPMGFGGALSIMVGVNPDSTVAGIKIVSHSETPGLGSRVNSETYLAQYIGLSGQLSLDGDVDAITGSTISSKAVLAGVNSALAIYDSVFGTKGGAQ